MRGIWVWAFLSVFLGACVDFEEVVCEDGSLCPSTLSCAPNGGCASTIQLANCEGKDDGVSCDTGTGQGTCNRGVCIGSQCGNGVVDEFEACDTGITTTSNTCQKDCIKFEICGDSVVDNGEQCDDGNQNSADGCSATCRQIDWVAQDLYGGGGLGAEETLDRPSGVFVDSGGDLFIADMSNHRVLRVDALTEVATVVAGTGVAGFSGDNGVATSAQLNKPKDVFVDGLGDLYIADRGNNRIRRVDAATGRISTVAGGGNPTDQLGDNGAAISARIDPYAIFVTGNRDIYIADGGPFQPGRIRRVDGASGIITTVAGGGSVNPELADGEAATNVILAQPSDVTVVGIGENLEFYIADYRNNRVRRVDSKGIITTVAGGGDIPVSGDDQDAREVQLIDVSNVTAVGSGEDLELYVVEQGREKIHRISTNGKISTVAGGGSLRAEDSDGGDATSARFSKPKGIAVFGHGADLEMYISDQDDNRIRRVDSGGVITTAVGGDESNFVGDGGDAISAVLDFPAKVAVVGSGADIEFFIADALDHRIRRVDSGGVITTVAGNGKKGFSGDEGDATSARLDTPSGVSIVGSGADRNIYIADASNHRIRRVDSGGVITTVAGSGPVGARNGGFSGDDGNATNARLDSPLNVSVVGSGADLEIYIADTENHRIRRVDSGGVITTVAGSGPVGAGNGGFGGDEGDATSAILDTPRGLTVVDSDAGLDIYIADAGNDRIRRVDSDGVITTVAGSGTGGGFSGDDEDATIALLDGPSDVSVVGDGADLKIYIADTGNRRIRRVDADGTIVTVAGTDPFQFPFYQFEGDGGNAKDAIFLVPLGVSAVESGSNVEFYIADSENRRIRRVDSDGVVTTVAGETSLLSSGSLATNGVGDGSDPQGVVLWSDTLLLAGGSSGTVQEVDIGASRFDVVVGRYSHEIPTDDLARFRSPDFGMIGGVAVNKGNGDIFLTETDHNRVHVVTTDDPENGVDPDDANTWRIAVLAGDGTNQALAGYSDGALATSLFRGPAGLFFNEDAGLLYVADAGNHVIRAIRRKCRDGIYVCRHASNTRILRRWRSRHGRFAFSAGGHDRMF